MLLPTIRGVWILDRDGTRALAGRSLGPGDAGSGHGQGGGADPPRLFDRSAPAQHASRAAGEVGWHGCYLASERKLFAGKKTREASPFCCGNRFRLVGEYRLPAHANHERNRESAAVRNAMLP